MRVAVVGAGIGGLLAARLLCDEHEVTVFEASGRVGGHLESVSIARGGRNDSVEVGACLFHRPTYPLFFELAARLGLRMAEVDTSFRVHRPRDGSGFAGTLERLSRPRPLRWFSPSLLRLARDVRVFTREARRGLRDDAFPDQTVGAYLAERRFGRRFGEEFLLPLIIVVWGACSPEEARAFSIRATMTWWMGNGPGWRQIEGGTDAYVAALTAPFDDRIRLDSPVEWIRRGAEGVTLQCRGAPPEGFDAAVLAVPGDAALRMLQDACDAEREVLGRFAYSDFSATLHTDAAVLGGLEAFAAPSLMIRVREATGRRMGGLDMVHNLTRMFALAEGAPVFVSRGDIGPVRREHHLGALETRLPILSPDAIAAQSRVRELNGSRHTFFCGSYCGLGEHEDAVRSALEVGRHFGKSLETL